MAEVTIVKANLSKNFTEPGLFYPDEFVNFTLEYI